MIWNASFKLIKDGQLFNHNVDVPHDALTKAALASIAQVLITEPSYRVPAEDIIFMKVEPGAWAKGETRARNTYTPGVNVPEVAPLAPPKAAAKAELAAK